METSAHALVLAAVTHWTGGAPALGQMAVPEKTCRTRGLVADLVSRVEELAAAVAAPVVVGETWARDSLAQDAPDPWLPRRLALDGQSQQAVLAWLSWHPVDFVAFVPRVARKRHSTVACCIPRVS